jgi:hypothetical protein
LNSDVLVWRKGNTGQLGSWQGLYKLVAIEGESCVLALLRGNTTFRSTSIKPFYARDIEVSSKGSEDDPKYYSEGNSKDNTGMIPPTILPISPKYSRGRSRKNPNITIFL